MYTYVYIYIHNNKIQNLSKSKLITFNHFRFEVVLHPALGLIVIVRCHYLQLMNHIGLNQMTSDITWGGCSDRSLLQVESKW